MSLGGHIAIGSHLAVVKVDGQSLITLTGELVCHGADVVVQTPPLVNHDDTRKRALRPFGARKITLDGLAIDRGVGDRFSHD